MENTNFFSSDNYLYLLTKNNSKVALAIENEIIEIIVRKMNERF